MDNSFFGKPYTWVATMVILFTFALTVFVIACLLGMFVDPDMEQGTRSAIVIAWGCAMFFAAPFICAGRHG